MNIAEFIRRNARLYPDDLAVIDRGVRTTNAEYDRRVNRFANAARDLGARPGDRVAVLADNSALVYEVYGGAAKAALMYVPINFRASAGEVAAIVGDCRPSILVVGDGYRDRLKEVDDLPADRRPVIVSTGGDARPGDRGYEAELAAADDADPLLDIPGERPWTLVYTSGTTGVFKAVQMTHDQTVSHAMCSVLEYSLRRGSRYLLALPHTSAGSVHNTFPECLMVGAALIFEDVRSFSAERFLENVQGYRATHSHIVPTMAFRILEHPGADRYDLSSLETLGYGGAPTPAHQVARLMELFGPILIDVYGMTEVGATATVLRKEHHVRFVEEGRPEALASAGVAAYGIEVRVLREDHTPCAPDEVGEIAFRGPYVMHGYWKGGGAVPDVFTEDGWLLSGDLGRMDAEGFLYVVDRKKDIIITGGLNVASREVEDVISRHPMVGEVAVVGVPDPEWGERVHAVIVARGEDAPSLDDVRAFCAEHLAGYKVPKAMSVVPDLPRNSMGKVVKQQLRQWLRRTAAEGR